MTIKPGDLVMVVKPTLCCGGVRKIGLIFRVAAIKRAGAVCPICLDVKSKHYAVMPDGMYVDIPRLKRIDPLREPEIIEERLAVKA